MIRPYIYVVVNGCQENHMDAALVKRFLSERHGFRVTDRHHAADVILVMGCSVTQHMENESLDLVDHFRSVKHPHTRLVVLGCVAKLRPELRHPDDGAAIPMDAVARLLRMDDNSWQLAVNTPHRNDPYAAAYLKQRKQRVVTGYLAPHQNGHRGSLLLNLPFAAVRRYKNHLESCINIYDNDTYSIKISTGCRGRCSYCSIRLSRGAVKSKPVDAVVAELKRGLAQGYRQFALMGTDIGDYGRETGLTLHHLLDRLISVPENFSLRLRNLNPRWLIPHIDGFLDFVDSGKIAYLQSPIQSANNRILELMDRGYTAQDYMDAVRRIRRRRPDMVIRTQLIAGFPTETDAEFQNSLATVKSGLFDYIDVFRFTPRKNTPAARLMPQVPFELIMQRYRRLLLTSLGHRPLRKLRAARRLAAVNGRPVPTGPIPCGCHPALKH